jgi:hypothetical protein
MRLQRTLALLLPVLGLAVGCGGSGGDNPSTPPPPPVPSVANTTGIWTGKYGNGTTTPNFDYRMVFFADGKSRIIDGLVASTDGANTAAGTWSLSGSTVAGTYSYPNANTFSTTGTINSALTTLAGTWGAGTSTTSGGTYSLTKEEGAVVGIWTGKYGSGSATPTANYRFILYAGGALQVDIDGTSAWSTNAKGTWSQSGAVVTGTYTYYFGGSTFSFSGTVSGNAMTGTWGNGALTTGGGTFSLTR